MRSLIGRTTALAALATLVVACAGGGSATPTPPASTPAPASPSSESANPSPSQEAVKLTYFTFSAAPDHLKHLDSIVQAFEAQHPNVTIEVQTAPYADYFTKLQTAVAGGTAPDTFELNYENFVTYAAAGTLLDLSAPSTADSTFSADAFYPKAYQVFQQDGKQYGLPASFSDVLLFYNKDLFDKAGVDYPTADWTWQDELDAAKKLTDSGAGTWGTFQPIQFFEFYKVLAQNGGSFFGPDGSVTFNDAKGVEAANYLIDKVGKVMPDNAFGPDEDTALFKAGKLAMWHSGIWQFAGLKDAPFAWDVQVEPGNVQKAHQFFANAAVASATTAHPDEAWAWLRFLSSSPEAVKTRLDNSWELPAVADQSQFGSYLSQTPPDNREAVFEALDAIVVPPVIEQQSQMQDIVSKALESARLGQVPVQQALDDAAQQVQALLP